jgi:hypothetical protein
MRKGERVLLNEKVTEEVIESAANISADKLQAFYFASYLPLITDCLASIADSLEILTKDLEEKEEK